MTLVTTVSIGDIILAVGMVASVVFNYAVNSFMIKQLMRDINDIRRGRGLIMGPNSDWPPQVRRCFGYGENVNPRS